MNNLTENNLKNIFETNFQNYLRIKNKYRKVRKRDEKKLRKNVKLSCVRQLSKSPRVVLNKTNGNSKSSFLQHFYLQCNAFKKGDCIENLLTFQGLLKEFTSTNGKTKKSISNIDDLDVRKGSEILISSDVDENPKEAETIQSIEMDLDFSKTNDENTIMDVAPSEEINLQESIVIPLENSSNQKDDTFSEILEQVECEFKPTENKTSSKKTHNTVETELEIENPLKRNLRTRTAANYNENISSFTFFGSTKYNPLKKKSSSINNNKTGKVRDMSPNTSFDSLSLEEDTSLFCNDKTTSKVTNGTKYFKCNDFLRLKKLSKNSKSSFEITLPKSLNTVLNAYPMKINIDLGGLNLHQLFQEQKIQDQNDRDVEETEQAVAFLTGELQPPKVAKKKTEIVKKKTNNKGKSKKGKGELANYLEHFSYNCDQNEELNNATHSPSHNAGIVSKPTADLSAPANGVMLTRNEKGEWITSVINSNEVVIDNNVMLSEFIDNNQFSQIANGIQLQQPPVEFVFNDSSQRDVTSPTTDFAVASYYEKTYIPPEPVVKNHFNQINYCCPQPVCHSVRNVNLQDAHQNTIPKKKNINSSNYEILDLTKPVSIKQKLKRQTDDIFKLGNVPNANIPPSLKQKLTIDEYRRKKAMSSKLGVTPKKASPDMPILDMDFCRSNESNNNNNNNNNEIEIQKSTSGTMLPVESDGIKIVTVTEPTNEVSNFEQTPTNNSTNEFHNSPQQNDSYATEIAEILTENDDENNKNSESVNTLEIANSCKNIQVFQENCSELLDDFIDNSDIQMIKYNDKKSDIPNDKINEHFTNIDEINSENNINMTSTNNIKESNLMDNVSSQILDGDKYQSNLTTEVNSILFEEKEKSEILDDFLDLRNEALDFDDDSISILGDCDYGLFDKGDIEDTYSSTNNTLSNINITINDKEMKNKTLDCKSFKIPKLSGINNRPTIQKPSQPASYEIKPTGHPNHQIPRCWPNNPTNIIKHPDQRKIGNFPGTSDVKRSYQNNVSASKLFNSPCFNFLDRGVCNDIDKCRYQHFLDDPQTIKYQLEQLDQSSIKLAYFFVKQRSIMFQKYAQTFIEIFQERNDKEALSELLIDSKSYEFRFGLWKSIRIGLNKCGVGKIDALRIIIERVLDDKEVNLSNIDFLVELILDTDVIYFLNFITIFNNVESYTFKADSINRLASVFWQTNNYELQAVLLLVCNKFIYNKRDEINSLNPVVIDFVKMSAEKTPSIPIESSAGMLIRSAQPVSNINYNTLQSEKFDLRKQIHQRRSSMPNPQFQEKKIVCNGGNDKIKVQIIQQPNIIGNN